MSRSFAHTARAMLFASASLAASNLVAQDRGSEVPDPDPELERATFIVADGFEVNLYAADPLLAKPIQMNFDPAGRLWVASSEAYPQIVPGHQANDKIVILEDADGDGRAEKTHVFADGLLIPTGIEPGDGGAYIGASTELLHLRDTDGDGRADERRILLSGFGTEDTHHIVHTLRWGNDGNLYFNQSVYIHSHIETPWGVRRLGGGGIWQFRPESMRLEVFARGWWNAWGHDFDPWGQSFVSDGAGGRGISHAFPGSVFEAAVGATRILDGLNPGSPKFCGLEIVGGRHLPDDWQGNVITNDFRGHRVCRFVLSDEGSGYTSREQTELIKTEHAAFRPVDVKMGPDGAIYIADWYNPIIQHGEVDFRDPRRDHTHGRIWRVTAKGRPLVERPNLVTATSAELFEALKAPEAWTRRQARRVLKERDDDGLVEQLHEWALKLSNRNDSEQDILEAVWTSQALGKTDFVSAWMLCLGAKNPKIQAAALRMFESSDSAKIFADNSGELLPNRFVTSEHPRVRLEAILACRQIGTLEAAELVLKAREQPLDKNLEFASWSVLRDLQAVWMPSVAEKIVADARWLDALSAVDSPAVVAPALALIKDGKPTEAQRTQALELVVRHGSAEELRLVFDLAMDSSTEENLRATLLSSLIDTQRTRKVHPSGDLTRLQEVLDGGLASLRPLAVRLAGAWKVAELEPRLVGLAEDDATDEELRLAAIATLGNFGGPKEIEALKTLTGEKYSREIRSQAAMALAAHDAQATARAILQIVATSEDEPFDSGPMIESLLELKGGIWALRVAAEKASLPAEAAKSLVRVVRLSGRTDEKLIESLRKAGGLGTGPKVWTPDEMKSLLVEVAEHGDAARGEAVYRRKEMACQKCHAIGGAGGRVGPDMLSIGTTAQLDYLLESLITPNAKIKENYNATIVVTTDGRTLNGIKVRQTDDELVLRNAEDQEVAIPLTSIDEQAPGQSLMPTGLVDDLTRSELADLVRFLSELGKTPNFTVGTKRVVRRWNVLQMNGEPLVRLSRTGIGTIATDDTNLVWAPISSTVAGALPVEEIPSLRNPQKGRAKPTTPDVGFMRCALDVTREGTVTLDFGDVKGLRLWVDGEPTDIKSKIELELVVGRHQLTLSVDRAEHTQAISCQLLDVPGSTAQAQFANN